LTELRDWSTANHNHAYTDMNFTTKPAIRGFLLTLQNTVLVWFVVLFWWEYL